MKRLLFVFSLLLCAGLAAPAQVTFGGALAAGTTTGDPLGAAADPALQYRTSAWAGFAATPLCTGHSSPDGFDCAWYRAASYTTNTAGHPWTVVHVTPGVHLLNAQMIPPAYAGSYNNVSIVCEPGAIIQANVSMGAMVYHAPNSDGSQIGSFKVSGPCMWDMHHLATGAIDIEGMNKVEVHNQSAEYIAPGDTRYSAFVFGTNAKGGGVGDAIIDGLDYTAGGGAATAVSGDTDIRATLSGGHTGYITGWLVGQKVGACTFVAGTASTGTPGTYSATITGGGYATGNFPAISYVVNSSGQIASCNVSAYGFMGTGAPTVTLAAGAPTGASITPVMNTGAKNFGQNFDFLGQNNGTIPIIHGHGAGQYPCGTMPAVYDITSPNYLTLINPPTVSYDSNFAVVSVAMPTGIAASAWSGGCSDQYTTPDGVVHDAPIMLKLYTAPGIANAIVTRIADGHNVGNFQATAGFQCGVLALNGGNVYSYNHFYGQVRNGNCDQGGNEWAHTELDSSWDAGFLVTNSNSTIDFTRQGFDANSNYAGASIVTWGAGSGSGQKFLYSINQAIPAAAPQFTKYICPTGPCEAAGVGYSGAYDVQDGFGVTEPAHERQPLSLKAFVFNHATASSSQTLFNLSGSQELSFDVKPAIGCTGVAAGTATLTITYKDPSSTSIPTSFTVNCGTAGQNAGQTFGIRAFSNSAITATLTDSSGVSVSGSVTLVQTTPN